MSDMYKTSKRCYLIDHHSPPPPAVTLENLDYAQYEEFIRMTHADSMMLYCKDHWGYCWYPTKVARGQMHPGLRGDFVGEISSILRRLNIEFTAYYCFEYDTLAGRSVPQWRVQAPDGAPVIRDDAFAKWSLCCMRTGYRQYCLDQLAEIVAAYRPDALFLDIFGMSLCYCPNCQEAYRSRYGSELPAGSRALKENRGRVLAFLEDSERELLREVYAVVKGIDPTLAVTLNFASHYPEDTRKMLDYQFCEPVLGDNWFSAAYTRDTAEGRYPLLMPGEFSSVYNYAHAGRYVAELSEIAAQGCRTGMYSGVQHVDGALEMTEAAHVGQAYGVIRDMEPFTRDRRPVRYVGILQSDAAKAVGDYTFYQDSILRLKRLEPHTKAVLGAMRLCEHAKVPWRILTQKAAESETLGGYPILLLPEVFILTEKMTEVLTRYVREGGLLVAAHDTGLYNDHGVRMDRNTLSGLLGVDVIHTDNRYARNGWGAYLRPTGPFAPGRYGETTPPVSSRFNSTKADGAEVLMEYRLPAVPVDDGHWVNWWSPPPGPLSGGAALTKKQTGKGLAFYAGFDLFTMAADREYPHLNDLMTGILQYASAPPPIRLETDTPDYLYTGFFENGTKLYLHQIIHPPKHYDGMIPAVPGGAAVLPKDIPVKEAWLVYPVRRELAVSVEKDAQRIALPSVETNSIVEITLCE